MTFGEVLKTARAERGYTLAVLAEKVGRTGSYLSRLERGGVLPPPRKEVLRYAEALEMIDADRLELMTAALADRGVMEIDHIKDPGVLRMLAGVSIGGD